jgi:recombinational DNA repair protein (RecF pathway)
MQTPNEPVESCARCGDDIGPGSPLYFDRVPLNDDRVVCSACAAAVRGHVTPDPEPDVPITMPNTNLPQSH